MAMRNVRRAMNCCGDMLAQSRQALLFEHGFQFVRRPGQQHDVTLAVFVFGFEPLAGGGAKVVLQYGGAIDNRSLLFVVRRHATATLGEHFVEGCNQVGIGMDFATERFGNTLASQIVFGGSESTHEDDDLRSSQSCLCCLGQIAAVVADDGFERHLDPDFIQLFREE